MANSSQRQNGDHFRQESARQPSRELRSAAAQPSAFVENDSRRQCPLPRRDLAGCRQRNCAGLTFLPALTLLYLPFLLKRIGNIKHALGHARSSCVPTARPRRQDRRGRAGHPGPARRPIARGDGTPLRTISELRR